MHVEIGSNLGKTIITGFNLQRFGSGTNIRYEINAS